MPGMRSQGQLVLADLLNIRCRGRGLQGQHVGVEPCWVPGQWKLRRPPHADPQGLANHCQQSGPAEAVAGSVHVQNRRRVARHHPRGANTERRSRIDTEQRKPAATGAGPDRFFARREPTAFKRAFRVRNPRRKSKRGIATHDRPTFSHLEFSMPSLRQSGRHRGLGTRRPVHRLRHVGACGTQRASSRKPGRTPAHPHAGNTSAGRVLPLGRPVSSLPRGYARLVLRHRRRTVPLSVLRRYRLYGSVSDFWRLRGFSVLRPNRRRCTRAHQP